MTPIDERNWQPATFRERGVAVPFTTPLLAGARLRMAERRHDVVVPHPGGVRGVYIFALASLGEFCAPTLHDRLLAERLASLWPLSPAGIRRVAREVGQSGAAGRAAAKAASAGLAAEAAARSRFEQMLLNAVLGEDVGNSAPAQRTAEAVRNLAGRTGRDAEALLADIGRLSLALADSGLDWVGSDGRTVQGRCGRLLGSLEAMRTGLSRASDEGGTALGAVMGDVVAALLRAASTVLGGAQRLLGDPAALLITWAAGAEQGVARLHRADWLLDGWEALCLLWQVAETGDQRAWTTTEIGALLPPVPPEADAWFATPEPVAALRAAQAACLAQARPIMRASSDMVTLIARNERIRALAA